MPVSDPRRTTSRSRVRDCLLWWADPGVVAERHRALLTAAERSRADAYHRRADRDRFTVGATLSRLVLGHLLDLPARDVPLRRDCVDCGGPHGRPRLDGDDWHLSVSHSGARVVVAVTRIGAVGVDVQVYEPAAVTAAETVMSAAELDRWRSVPPAQRVPAFFATWVRKEAAVKATGDGLRVPLGDVQVTGYERSAALLAYSGRPGLRMWMTDVDGGAGYAAAVAVLTGHPADVQHRDGTELLAST